MGFLQNSNDILKFTQKADKSYVDNLISTVSASPKGTYATVAALTSAIPAGNSNIYLVTADGKWYFWNGSAWTAGGVYQATGVVDRSITSSKINYKAIDIEHLNIVEQSTNLINENKFTTGYTLSNSTGEPTANVSYSVSDFFPVKPSTDYRMANITRWAIYDSNKTFIISATTQAINASNNYNSYYARIVLSNSVLSAGTGQMNEGNTLLTYQKYFDPRFTDVSGLKKAADLRDDIVTSTKILNKAVTINHIDFIDISSNLLDTMNLKKGFTIDGTTGLEISSSTNNVSDFIKIKANTSYISSNVARRAFYDNTKVFISSTTGNSSFTTPSNAYYVKWVVGNTHITDAQVNEGSTLLAYEPYYRQFTKESGLQTTQATSAIDISKLDYYIQSLNTDEIYTAPEMEDVSEDSGQWMKARPYSDIYTFYDELVSMYPNYVTKTVLGAETSGKSLCRYDFKPQNPIYDNTYKQKIPKVFLTVGTHGSEKTSVWVMLQTMKLICENWSTNTALEKLRWGVHFIVIPLLNPYGWEMNARKNANGVDLARNYPTGWVLGNDPTASTYGGTSPLSEIETQFANTILVENKEDLIYICDFHNFFITGGFIWNASATRFGVNLGNYFVSKLSRKWKKEHTFLPQDENTFFGHADDASPNGSIGKHAVANGIQGSTFEISEEFGWETLIIRNSPIVIQFGVEAIVNWLNFTLKNFSSFYNNK